jgi:hypothetical protein
VAAHAVNDREPLGFMTEREWAEEMATLRKIG